MAEETSYGNAGIIQREGVVPYTFPRDPVLIAKYAFNLLPEANLHWSALPRIAPWLFRHWRSLDARAQSTATARGAKPAGRALHRRARGADGRGRRARPDAPHRLPARLPLGARPWTRPSPRSRPTARPTASTSSRSTRRQVAELEPHSPDAIAGGVLMPDPVSVGDPGARREGLRRSCSSRAAARFLRGEARTPARPPAGMDQVRHGTAARSRRPTAVVALGPWSSDVFRPFGYRFPLGVKRGYHRHFRRRGQRHADRPVLDAERGYVLVPMTARHPPHHGRRVRDPRCAADAGAARAGASGLAREIFPLGERVDNEAWLGRRPCLPDMLPIVGAAPRHKGLWLDFGHHHLGFTLGPVTGRLLAEMMTGETAVHRSGALSGGTVLAERPDRLQPQLRGRRAGCVTRIPSSACHFSAMSRPVQTRCRIGRWCLQVDAAQHRPPSSTHAFTMRSRRSCHSCASPANRDQVSRPTPA